MRISDLLPFARYEVEGLSMTPALLPGERVFVSRAAYWLRAPRPGDAVVVRDPRDERRLVVKRIEREEGGRWVVAGDNPEASTDSRTFGAVERRQIVGKVLFRY